LFNIGIEEFDLFNLNPDISAQLQGTNTYIDMDFTYLLDSHEDYAKQVLKNPDAEIKILSGIASRYADRTVTVQLHNFPYETPIYQLHETNLNKLAQVTGMVIPRGERKQRPSVIAYKCTGCGEDINVQQTEQWRQLPDKCDCKDGKGFTRIFEDTEFDDCQWLQIQELVDNTKISHSPAR